jgi:outer membrane protein assembly factor BamD (BamD/ComL family)
MAATLGANPTERDDSGYQEALRFFHMGEWSQAISALEGLRSRYPDDPRILRMLDDARFKANLDAKSTVREKRVILPWRAILLRVITIALVIGLLALGYFLIQWRVLPIINAMQLERQQQMLLAEAQALFAANDLAAAEEQYLAILQKFPEMEEAQNGLAAVRSAQGLLQLYDEAVGAEQNGDDATALKLYNELQMKSAGYRDVGTRILAIRHRGELAELYSQAVTLKKLGLEPEAIATLFQIQSLDVNYQQEAVRNLLHTLNLKQGQRIIEADPPEPAQMPQALDYFNAALEQKPNDPVALTEARLAVAFIAGRDAYNTQNWTEAVSRLRVVYNERSDYLAATVVNLLYQALINLGDQLVTDDLLAAYEQYSQACNLPVADPVTACAKASSVIPLLTPTPTPTLTPTPAPTGTPGPTVTPTPTATPRPLEVFRNRIVFKSDNPELPGYYVMNPDGSSREFLGPFDYYDDGFDALRETERFSPDKTYYVSTGDVDSRAQVILHLPYDDRWGQLAPKPLTRLTGIAYDPVWAPDGSWIAFTAAENESDDIWVIRPDASEQKSLMRNEWEWDKHASFSPDSKRIAFFSNRFGERQILIMDVTGQNIINISNVPWAEYDPIWVK